MALTLVREVRKTRASQSGIGDLPAPYQPVGQQNQQINQQQPGQLTEPQQASQSTVESNTDDSYLTIDDLLVIKPGFDGELHGIATLAFIIDS